jgi:hypothetical protein
MMPVIWVRVRVSFRIRVGVLKRASVRVKVMFRVKVITILCGLIVSAFINTMPVIQVTILGSELGLG